MIIWDPKHKVALLRGRMHFTGYDEYEIFGDDVFPSNGAVEP